MQNQNLHYYMHDGPSAYRFEIAGYLDEDGSRRLEQDWLTASSVARGRTLIIDMTFVTGLDDIGSALIRRWHRDGAQIVAKSKLSIELAEEAIGRRLEIPRVMRPARNDTWMPFRTSREVIGKLVSSLQRVEAPSSAEKTSSRPAAARANSLQLHGAGTPPNGVKRAS